MGVSISFEPATYAHAQALAARMRPEDVREVYASGGYTALEAVLDSMPASDFCHTLLFDGEVAAIYGAAGVRKSGTVLGADGVACAWTLTSELVGRHPRAFLKASRFVVDRMLERYLVLYNHVDARYLGALRWARWLGFTVHPAAPFGQQGLPFHLITLRKESAPHV